MRKKSKIVLMICVLALLIPGMVFASQDGPTLNLGLIRNFGYGGLGKIQGSFTLRVVDPPTDLAEVNFYMDGELMEVVLEPPFQTKFTTSEFSEGEHQMSAEGTLGNGSEVYSNTVTKVFLSSDQAWSETGRIIVPLLAGVGILTLIGIGAPFLLGRKREHTPGKYGAAGGAVCPRCSLPFSRPFLAPNLMVGKLVRCPHCGKISILPAASHSRLQEAESRFAGEESPKITTEAKDNITKMIEDSRFED
jgi:hypothetical protein